jgi:hypothetical protein
MLLGCAVLVGLSEVCWSQATINEGLETAAIYVDASKGSDSNNGSKMAPLKTIGASVGKAMANNYASTGTRVIINPGTYRESVSISGDYRSTKLPITFQAATNGSVFISGADLMSGWTVSSQNPKIFQNNWPYRFGICAISGGNVPFEQEIMLRAEMVIVGGMPLTQVLSLSSMLPGTFFIDDAHAMAYVYPPSGTNMSTATVEVATRPHMLEDDGQSYVVFRGLTFQYANSCHGNAAVVMGRKATNVLFDSDTFVWNNSTGLAFTAQYVTVQNSVALHNGALGFSSYHDKHDLWQNDVANYNNWRGAQAAFYTWDTGGAKWFLDHDGTYTNVTAAFNEGNGFAWDTDQQNLTVSGMVSADNVTNGIQIEKDEGPIKFSNSYVCDNNLLGLGYRGGIVLRNSEAVTITGSALYENGGNQIAIVGQAGGLPVTNWETGLQYNLISKDLTSTGNTMHSTLPNVFFSDQSLGGTDWAAFLTTLNSNNNIYYSGSNSTTNAFVIPAPRNGTKVDFSSWKLTTAQDTSSSWKSSSVPAACNLRASTPDFWLVANTFSGARVDASRHATFAVTAYSLGGLTGSIALKADLSAVRGLTGSFSPSSISTTGATVLTVTAGSTVARGTYPITILGNLGNITRTVTLSLVVP